MMRPPSSSSAPAAIGSESRSCSSPMPSAAATNGSASDSVAAVAAVTRRRPVTYSQYASATVTGPSHPTMPSDRGPASADSFGSVHGARAAPPSNSVTGTAASMFTLAPIRCLADTV